MAYIPRSSLMNSEAQSAIPSQIKRRHTVRVFNLITTMLFVASLAGTVGVFLYTDVVEDQLLRAREALNQTGDTDISDKMSEISAYDSKLTVAYSLLNNHLAPSLLLKEIENTTKETVQFSDFEYTYDPGFEVLVTLGGKTEELTSVALQKMQLLKDGLFSDFVVSDITTASALDALGDSQDDTNAAVAPDSGAGFSVKGVFKKDLMEYTGDGIARTESAEPEVLLNVNTNTTDTPDTNDSIEGSGSEVDESLTTESI